MPIVNNTVNAVAMTVLPDAPTDPVTGLKVPTIAVATGTPGSGGVSVIRNNGTVFSFSPNGRGVNNLVIQGNRIYYEIHGNLTSDIYVSDIRTGATILGYSPATNVGSNKINNGSATSLRVGPSGLVLRSIHFGGNGNIAGWFLNRLITLAKDSMLGNSVASHIGRLYNAAWMPSGSAARRAYLSSSVVGSAGPTTELFPNGDYSSPDNSDWVKSTSAITLSITGGVFSITFTANNQFIYKVIPVTPGKVYRVRSSTNNNTNICFGLQQSNNADGSSADTSFVGGLWTNQASVRFLGPVIEAVPTKPYLLVGYLSVGSETGFITLTSVQEDAEFDRTYRRAGASITGSLVKSQVASAAQLVAYSGFSNANYLREPYSADLDFGTGEWNASAWVNVPAVLPVSSFPNVGSNLQVNGTFDTDLTGWVKTSGVGEFSVVGGELYGDGTAGEARLASTAAITLTAGKWYRVSCTARRVTGSRVRLFVGVDNSANYGYGILDFTSTSNATQHLYIFGGTGGFLFAKPNVENGTSGYYDNISVSEVSSALVADRAHSSGAKISLGLTPTGFLTATAHDGTTTRTATTTAAYNTATWLKAEANYTTDGTLAIMVNGVEVATARGAPLLSLNNSNAVLTIGNSYAADAPFPGSIALLKLGATVPTAEQSVWMYEQEKQMFREGAQVTLPDAGAILDLAYDDLTDKWIAVSAANESEWSGLVRTSVTPTPAGSYSKVSAASGVQLLARTTTNPGVDITVPAQNLREELIKRGEVAARMNAQLAVYDYVGGFTATTVSGSTAITSVASLTYPVSYVGARVTGAGIPADTFVAAVVGTTVYLTKPATASASAVAISFTDFILPTGMEAKEVSLAGAAQREGATAQFTRLFDGFKETIRFGTAPSNTALIQIQAARSAA